MKKIIFSLVILSSLYLSLIAQESQKSQTVFQHFTMESGLALPIVKGIIQDKEGYIWVGTANAIHRFDGFNFKTIKYEAGRKTNMTKGPINVLYVDKIDNLWLGTSGGLNRFNKSTEEFKQYVPDPLGPVFKNDMWSIFEDSKGLFWVGASMGLYYLEKDSTKLVPFVFPEKNDLLSNVSFRAIAEDNQGYLWFGTGVGLLKYNRNTKEITPFWIDPNPPALLSKTWNTGDYAVQSICLDNSGILWAGAFGGSLLKINPTSGKTEFFILKDKNTLETFQIQSICQEDENTLWIGTFNGLMLFDKFSGKILQHHVYDENFNESLSDNKITRVLKDRSGSLWIGTLAGGLNKLNRTTVSFNTILRKAWGAEKSFFQTPFSDLVISGTGSLLAGTMNGIEEINQDGRTMTFHPPFKAINTFIKDSKGNLWIAVKQFSGGGFYKKDTKGNLHPVADSTGTIFNKEIQCIIEMKNGRLFFGSEFYLFEVDLIKNSASLILRSTRRIWAITEDINNVLCLGTMSGGLLFFNPDTKTVIKHYMPDENDPYSISDINIPNVFLDSKKRLWICTSLGLNKYERDTERFICYNEDKGLANNIVLKIIEDKSGNLWLGTSIGISKFNPETEKFKNYDASYGLIKTHYYTGVISESGEIFFKGRTGIVHFNPDWLTDNSFVPPVVITELKVFNEFYPFSRGVELSYDENYISLEFAALSYVSPEKNQYAYMMEGVDKEWIYPGRRRYAAYTDLNPGEYTFRVKASNNDGLWNQQGTLLNIIINPPWYKTYWAYSFYFLFIVFIFYNWRKYDLKQQNLRYQLKLEHSNAQKQEEISRLKSRFFTNISHEFRTPLTLIIGPAEKIIDLTIVPEIIKQATSIKKNAFRLLALINQLLDISTLEEGKLKLQVSKKNLVHFIRGVVMNYGSYAESKDIVLKIDSSEENIEVYFDGEKMGKILTNILSNAFKFTPEGGTITVNILETYFKKVVIKIKDTGIGIPEKELSKLFDRFYQVDNSQTREHEGTGIGLSLTKELVELHKGNIHINSKEGEWTEVTIELPLGRDFIDGIDVIEENVIHNKINGDKYLKEQFYAEAENKSYSSNSTLEKMNSASDKSNGERQIILIVEDNPDVRDYIKESMGEEFQVYEAANGDQGIKKAQEIIPDLIICDIMMPKMDGYEMTKLIKSNEITNHIPIIHLTAKSDRESKFEGLETGADDYIIKPFDTKELKLRICNLIKIRKTLQEKFANSEKMLIRKGEKSLGGANEKFMIKVIEVVERHLAEEDFSIEHFARDIGMSRTQLHRKMKALTGKSASHYVRSFRLAVAKKMIEQKEGNISEIAYSVGFSTPMYFSKCFKDEYGIPPSEFTN